FKEHLAAAREQKAVRWLRGAIARFGPCVSARKFGDDVLRDRQLRRAYPSGLHERLHQMIESREGGNCRARYCPCSAQRDILFGEDGCIAGIAAGSAALDTDRIEAGGVLLS